MSNPELFLIKDDIKRPTSKFQNDDQSIIESLSRSSSNSHSKDKKEEMNSRIVSTKQGESDEEDGFKTPTSLDHRISVAKECPPPPRKIKPSLKRKAPYNHCNYRHPLDLSKQVELLFPTHHIPLSHSHQTIKKVRSQEPK